jgi:hypothetical protein
MHMQHLSPCFGQGVEEVAGVTEGNGCEQRPAEDEHIRRRVPAGAGYLHPLDEQVDPVPHHGEAGDSAEEVEQLEQALEEPLHAAISSSPHSCADQLIDKPICQPKRAQSLMTIQANEPRRISPSDRRRGGGGRD